MEKEYCQEIHVAVFFQKKLFHNFMSDEDR